MRILVVDDNQEIRNLLSCCLHELGHCDTVDHGLTAAEKFSQAFWDENLYHSVTMDCPMPALDGFGAISMIRTFEASQHSQSYPTPICLISTDYNYLQRYEKQQGQDNYLPYCRKPFRVDELHTIAGRTSCHKRTELDLTSTSFVYKQSSSRPLKIASI